LAILITGLGYVGSALAQRLLDRGERVIGVENFFSTPKPALAPLQRADRFTLIDGSIADRSTLDRAFSIDAVDRVVHLAAQSSTNPRAAPVEVTQETNFTGPRIVLEACRQHGVSQVVFVSSMRLYRTPLPRRLTESSPVEPTDLVHLSQLYGEMLLTAYAEDCGREHVGGRARCFSGVALRLGIVHGLSPVMKADPRFLAAPQLFCHQAARGEPLRVATGPRTSLAFVHIDDAVEALVRSCTGTSLPPILNVASEVRSVASIARAVRDAGRRRGLRVDIRYEGRPSRASSRTVPAHEALGFRPALRFERSVGPVLDHYLSTSRV